MVSVSSCLVLDAAMNSFVLYDKANKPHIMCETAAAVYRKPNEVEKWKFLSYMTVAEHEVHHAIQPQPEYITAP
jgi:hypothetical protein